MKIAFMTFSCPELAFDAVLDLARRLGYDGIEPRAEAAHQHGVEVAADARQRATFRDKARDAGIALCCLATSRTYADPAERTPTLDATRALIDLAADIGAPRLRVFGGQIAKGLSRQDGIDCVAESLLAVADHARARGVTICLETHDDWCDPDHMAAVLSKANHDAIAVNWDIMHPVLSAGRTMAEAHATLRPWIRHVHVHDGRKDGDKFTFLPIGEGLVDHDSAMALLADDDYDGFLSGEWIGWEPYETHLPRELAALRRCERA